MGEQNSASGGLDLDRLAHELRTPLAAIQSTADALANGHLGSIDPRHAAYLAGICETARHALAVIGDMVGAVQPASAALACRSAHVDLHSIVAEVVSGMAMLAARAGVRLSAEVNGHGARAWGSATDVRQMLINLVSNGISHGGGGATVRVTVGRNGAGEVWLDVTDDGPGFPPGVSEQLEAGALLDEKGLVGSFPPRARLGLRLTRQLAAANGGRLELLSGPDGTRARVVLSATPGTDASPGGSA